MSFWSCYRHFIILYTDHTATRHITSTLIRSYIKPIMDSQNDLAVFDFPIQNSIDTQRDETPAQDTLKTESFDASQLALSPERPQAYTPPWVNNGQYGLGNESVGQGGSVCYVRRIIAHFRRGRIHVLASLRCGGADALPPVFDNVSSLSRLEWSFGGCTRNRRHSTSPCGLKSQPSRKVFRSQLQLDYALQYLVRRAINSV